MRILLFLSILTAVALAKVEVNEKRIKELALECAPELSIEADKIDLLLKHQLGDSEQHDCLLRCIYRKIGFIDENGRVQLGDYDSAIPEHTIIRKTMSKCQHIVIEKCGDVTKLIKCGDDAFKKLNSTNTQ